MMAIQGLVELGIVAMFFSFCLFLPGTNEGEGFEDFVRACFSGPEAMGKGWQVFVEESPLSTACLCTPRTQRC